MTTDMGRDMAGDMARELGTVFSWLPTTPDPMSLSLFLWVARFLVRPKRPRPLSAPCLARSGTNRSELHQLWEIDDE
jgi:hypothetical protein